MQQTKKSSILEVLLNQGSGFIIAYLVWKHILAPLIHQGVISVESSMVITIVFTLISIIRGYIFRRIFNYYLHKSIDRIE